MSEDQIVFRPVARNPRYEVSSKGGFFRVGKDGGRHELSPEPDDKGRPRVKLWYGRGRKPERVRLARLVLEAFAGPAPPGRPYACHEDDDVANSRADNLYWGSPQSNYQDARRNGRIALKHTDTTVRRVRELARDGHSAAQIADATGVPASYVRDLVRGRFRRPRPNGPTW